MSAVAVVDLVLVIVLVLAAAAYMVWKLVLRQPTARAPQVRLGGTLARALGNSRQNRTAKR